MERHVSDEPAERLVRKIGTCLLLVSRAKPAFYSVSEDVSSFSPHLAKRRASGCEITPFQAFKHLFVIGADGADAQESARLRQLVAYFDGRQH